MKEHRKAQAGIRKLFSLKIGMIALAGALSIAPLASSWADAERLPNINLPTLSGSRLTNKTLAGKVYLLNVWGSWCKYCYYEHEMLMTIKNNYKVPIYGINLKDNPSNARAWLKNYGNPYVAVGEDPAGVASDALDVYGTPQTFVVDKKGIIRYRQNGGIDQSNWTNTIWPLIQKLRSEK